MKYSISFLVCLIASSAFCSEKNLNLEYQTVIEKLTSSCSKLKPYNIPKTTNEIFCSDNPVNQISVRYCLFQNILKPENDQSITFEMPVEKLESGETITTSVTMDCRNI